MTTIVCGMNALGMYIPPMMLFRRKRMNEALMRGSPLGAIGYASAKGNALFVKYMEHFIQYTKPSEANKILLVFDGNQSQKTLEVIEMAKANHITLVTLPPHTSLKRARFPPFFCLLSLNSDVSSFFVNPMMP